MASEIHKLIAAWLLILTCSIVRAEPLPNHPESTPAQGESDWIDITTEEELKSWLRGGRSDVLEKSRLVEDWLKLYPNHNKPKILPVERTEVKPPVAEDGVAPEFLPKAIEYQSVVKQIQEEMISINQKSKNAEERSRLVENYLIIGEEVLARKVQIQKELFGGDSVFRERPSSDRYDPIERSIEIEKILESERDSDKSAK